MIVVAAAVAFHYDVPESARAQVAAVLNRGRAVFETRPAIGERVRLADLDFVVDDVCNAAVAEDGTGRPNTIVVLRVAHKPWSVA